MIYTYPNAVKGATYTVFDRSLREEAHWDEFPSTSRFGAAAWNGTPAVFYLQGSTLIVRGVDGRQLARLPAPGGDTFSRVHVANAGGRLVLVASGNGYTPFHMVAVYDGEALVYHEVADEHAFALAPEDDGFVVSTRSTQWQYRLPGG